MSRWTLLVAAAHDPANLRKKSFARVAARIMTLSGSEPHRLPFFAMWSDGWECTPGPIEKLSGECGVVGGSRSRYEYAVVTLREARALAKADNCATKRPLNAYAIQAMCAAFDGAAKWAELTGAQVSLFAVCHGAVVSDEALGVLGSPRKPTTRANRSP